MIKITENEYESVHYILVHVLCTTKSHIFEKQQHVVEDTAIIWSLILVNNIWLITLWKHR